LCRVVESDTAPRTKVAALDWDGTLFQGRAQWPRHLHDYELWNAAVLTKLREWYDTGNCKLVVLANKGGIQGAFGGKTADSCKAVLNWLAQAVGRPVHVVLSTKKSSGFHKPAANMWKVAEMVCNQGVPFDVATSLYVGDSVVVGGEEGGGATSSTGEEPTGPGSDVQFARNVGGVPFSTPHDAFGPSNMELREKQTALAPLEDLPETVLKTRAALLGGYYNGPILLILCGAQGSGKSTFCAHLISASNSNWVHLSQDTINNGKAGPREKVERAALKALQQDGKNVVVDRMHLDATQRDHFVAVAQQANVAVHCVVLNVAAAIAAQRVRDRPNHMVTGEAGAKLAVRSTKSLVLPTYREQQQSTTSQSTTSTTYALISATGTSAGALRLARLYSKVNVTATTTTAATLGDLNNNDDDVDTKKAAAAANGNSLPLTFPLAVASSSNDKNKIPVAPLELPTILLGTMGLGRKTAQGIVEQALTTASFAGVDTAPTYKNEDKVGAALQSKKKNHDVFTVVKVPKRAGNAEQVRHELTTSLANLRIDCADLLLLHWPCDDVTMLQQVWKEMEACVNAGLARAIGVCNFNVPALRALLPFCAIAPAVNQIERHPLLPQWDLVEFCAQHDICLQAHTPLGQGTADLLGHATVTQIAGETGTTPAQVVLAWNVQQGVAVVPKCSSSEHMQDVLASRQLCLTPEQMKALDEIGNGRGSTATKRFVVPPFMYGSGPFCWGKVMP